jgi:anti-sigma factor RsiW
MTCEQIVDLLVEYVEGELDSAITESVEKHVSECPDCEHFVNTYTVTIAMAERAFVTKMPTDAKAVMERQLRSAITGQG